MLWDRGTWRPKGDPRRGVRQGPSQVRARRRKAEGRLCAGAHARQQIRRQDRRPGVAADQGKGSSTRSRAAPSIVETAPNSVTTGRSLDEIAAARTHVWQSNYRSKANVKAGRHRQSRSRRTKRRREEGPPRASTRCRTARRPPSCRRCCRRCSRRWWRARRPDGLAARDQVRRLPDAVPHRARQGAALLAQRQGVDGGLPPVSPPTSRSCRCAPRGSTAKWSCSTRGPHELPGAAERADGPRTRRCRSSRSMSCTSTATTCAPWR